MGEMMGDARGSAERALDRRLQRIHELEFDPVAEGLCDQDQFSEAVGTFMALIKAYRFESIPYLKAALRRLEGELYAINTDEIPAILAEYGLKKAVMSDGTEVSTELFIETHTVDKVAMADWLKSIGAEDLIKDTIALGKGMFSPELREFLDKGGYVYKADSDCAAMTLKACIKKRYDEMGDDGLPPATAVEAKPYIRAKIKYPKAQGF